MDIDGLAFEAVGPGERFHAVDQRSHPVRLLANERRQLPVARIHIRLDKLGGAPDSGKRVLDLVGEHGRHAADRPRRASMHEVPVDLAGKRHRHEHDRDGPDLLGNGRQLRDHHGQFHARRLDGNLVFGEVDALLAHCLDHAEQRVVLRQDPAEKLPQSLRGACVQQALGGRVEGRDRAGPVHREHRRAQGGN